MDQPTSLGYRVIAASSEPRRSRCCASDDQVDLLFTDVVMPGDLAGRALAAKGGRNAPRTSRCCSLRAISRVRSWARATAEAEVQFLPKPSPKAGTRPEDRGKC